MRNEHAVFQDLLTLCTSPGYVHALALICYRENMVAYVENISAEDFSDLFRKDRLIRTEIETLLGLMVRENIDFSVTSREVAQVQIERTYALLEELHHALSNPSLDKLRSALEDNTLEDKSPGAILGSGEFLREPMFYSGESAYSSQFRDLAPRKYSKDNPWLEANKGFTIESAQKVALAIQKLLNMRLADTIDQVARAGNDIWTILPGFSFKAHDLTAESGISEFEIGSVLGAFTVSTGERNSTFTSLHQFNVVSATPILRGPDGDFVLLEQYSLLQALYETPFYWLGSDKKYVATAMANRGKFTEEFARERLQLVFGRSSVYPNVKVVGQKGKDAGEIDTLVLFGDRAIVLQAKSKRLTQAAKSGDESKIRVDFKQSVQDAYDQGRSCAEMLIDDKQKFETVDGKLIRIPVPLKEIFVLCVVADHYPALSFQARQFLAFKSNETIKPPFVLDVFTLDTMTEMLATPLPLLSYLNRRTGYSERVVADHELIILAYHLKHNLWIDQGTDVLFLQSDVSIDLDVAMTVRRDRIPGDRSIAGPLEHVYNTFLGTILRTIENRPDPKTIDLGYALLTLSGQTVSNLSKQIEALIERTREDRSSHDLSIPMGGAQEGLTFHCNLKPLAIAGASLRRHCNFRKYKSKARRWFGVCLHPNDGSVRLGITLDFPWKQDSAVEEEMKENFGGGRTINMNQSGGAIRKIGRNEPCPCQSGKKYKRCCLD